MRAQEFDNPKDKFVEIFRKFLPLAMKVIGLRSLPTFEFDKNLDTGSQPSFGMYSIDNKTLYIALANRHPNDILRTVAHELVHYKQDTEHELDDMSGDTGSPEENEANQIAGIVMRHFNKQYPEYLKTKPIVSEAQTNTWKRSQMWYTGDNDPGGPRTRQDYRVTDKIDWEHPELTAGMRYRIRADANSIPPGIKGIEATEKFYRDYEKYLKPHHKIEEKLNRTGSNELVIFDIDDTLLHTTAQIKVIDSETGKPKLSLTNQQFNNYKLKPGEEFDFGEFRDAAKFEEESVPIGPMLDKLRSDLSAGKNVVMLTARADFDNQKAVWRTFKRHGIDINRDVHLYRAGNQPGDSSPAVKKAIHVSEWLSSGKYNRVVMYDDSEKNLSVFKSLEKRFPNVEFEANHVSEEGDTKQVESDLNERRRKKKYAAYGPGPYGWYGYDAGYSGDSGDGAAAESAGDRGDIPTGKGEQLIPFPQGTTMVDVSDVYDWYKLGMVISDLDDADPKIFGQGAPHTVIAFGSEEEEHKLLPLLKRLGLSVHDIDRPEDVKKVIPAKMLARDLAETIRKVKGGYRLVSKKGKNLGTYPTHAGAEKRERQVQYFKHIGEVSTKDLSMLSESEATDRAIKILKGIGFAASQTAKGAKGVVDAVSAFGQSVMNGFKYAAGLAVGVGVITHPKEMWNAANFAWNFVTNPAHVTAVLGRTGLGGIPVIGDKWVDKDKAAEDLRKIMGNSTTSDVIFNLANLAVDNAIPIAGIIALLYGGKTFVDYLKKHNAIDAEKQEPTDIAPKTEKDKGIKENNKSQYIAAFYAENFADGRNPQDKGDSARHGIRKGMTIAQLKKIRSSKTASPRKKQLAHWQINMRQGKKK